MYALIDCNNFYCSCERLFDPALARRPVVVLSNNDGCVISRSEEAKALGIAMTTPAFMMDDFLKKNNVAVFSSNYTLYGDLSDRVMKTLASFVPRLEIYSIDEAFLDLHDMPHTNLLQLGIDIRKTIQQHIGIPVTIGIGDTKTLAKMANRYAKKKHKRTGVYWAANRELTDEMLSDTAVADIWGIGHQYALLLNRHGFKTAGDLKQAPDDWVREKLSVVGLRLLNELRGTPAIRWEAEPAPKKNICTSRSFGRLLTRKPDIAEALVNYTAACALKLRNQQSCCSLLQVFLHTNPHKTQERQYQRSINVELERPSSNTAELIKYALKGFDAIYAEGYRFMKAGIRVMNLVPDSQVQSGMFDSSHAHRDKKLMAAMDKVNQALGKEIVRMAVQGFEKKYRLRADHLSPRYTTNINHILKVKI
jgi:DNA polymerase V